MNVVTLPKTIDNDIALTDRSFGFDTALQIATEAVDRLHSTATSHERIIVVEVNKRLVPLDHSLITSGRLVGTSFGD